MTGNGKDDLRFLHCPAGKKRLDPAHVPPSCAAMTAARNAGRAAPERLRAEEGLFRCETCNDPLPVRRLQYGICTKCAKERRIKPLQPRGDIAPSEIAYAFGIAAYTWNPKID